MEINRELEKENNKLKRDLERTNRALTNQDKQIDKYRKSQEIAAQRREEKKSRKGKHFTRCELTMGRDLLHVLNSSERQFMFALLFYIEFQTGYIISARGERLNISDIAKLVGWKKNHTSKIVESLAQKGVLFKIPFGKEIEVMINAIYFFRGSEKDRQKWFERDDVKKALEEYSHPGE